MTSTFSPYKFTAIHDFHMKHHATIVDESGWKRPAYYSSSTRELEEARSTVGICDISPVGKFSIQGNDLSAYLPNVISQTADLVVNKSVAGTTLSDNKVQTTVCRFAQDEAFAICSPGQRDALLQALNSVLNGCAHVIDMTSNFAGISLSGPSSSTLLSKLTDINLTERDFPNLSSAQCKLAEVYAIILRHDIGQLPSYQIYVGRDFGMYVWESLLEAGHELGAIPIGVDALTQLSGGR